MVKAREAKVEKIADYIPEQELDNGPNEGDLLVIGWGSTYGTIKSAVVDLLEEGYSVSHAHIRYIRPFPKNLGDMIKRFKKVLVPEINNGQLVKILRDKYLVDAIPYNKIMGIPITKAELVDKMKEMLAMVNG
jgi:2-oxoglutarate ferredoxin oxidoreductase subunit alpha